MQDLNELPDKNQVQVGINPALPNVLNVTVHDEIQTVQTAPELTPEQLEQAKATFEANRKTLEKLLSFRRGKKGPRHMKSKRAMRNKNRR